MLVEGARGRPRYNLSYRPSSSHEAHAETYEQAASILSGYLLKAQSARASRLLQEKASSAHVEAKRTVRSGADHDGARIWQQISRFTLHTSHVKSAKTGHHGPVTRSSHARHNPKLLRRQGNGEQHNVPRVLYMLETWAATPSSKGGDRSLPQEVPQLEVGDRPAVTVLKRAQRLEAC